MAKLDKKTEVPTETVSKSVEKKESQITNETTSDNESSGIDEFVEESSDEEEDSNDEVDEEGVSENEEEANDDEQSSENGRKKASGSSKKEDNASATDGSTGSMKSESLGETDDDGSNRQDGSNKEDGSTRDEIVEDGDEESEISSIPSDENTDELEYGTDSDDSDDEAEKNRIGNVPLEWYEDEDHIGYDIAGEKIGKSIQKSEIDQLLNRVDNPDAWRTITDVKNQAEIKLTARDLEIIQRIRQHKLPYSTTDTEEFVEYDNPDCKLHPVSNRPEGKARFLPSKWEGMKIRKIARLMREGKIGPKKEKKEEVTDIWEGDEHIGRHKAPTALVAPKMALPTHAESFNPPDEYLFTEKEKQEWEEMDESERTLSFIPQKYGQLRKVPAYPRFITERFHRCLDLYLVPRALKKRMNVQKESLLPKLPNPAHLRPFPIKPSVAYEGHTKKIRSLSVDVSGHYLATASDDGYVIVWEVKIGRPVRRLKMGYLCQSVAFHPKDPNILALASESDLYFVNLSLHKSWAESTDETLSIVKERSGMMMDIEENLDVEDLEDKDEDKDEDEQPEENKNPDNSDDENGTKKEKTNFSKSLLREVVWTPLTAETGKAKIAAEKSKAEKQTKKEGETADAEAENLIITRGAALYQKGVRIHIRHDGDIKTMNWHRSGNYLSVVSVNCSSKSNECIIHSLQAKSSIRPFGKMSTGSGVAIQETVFHPTKPLFFVATQRNVKVFHLQKHQLLKQLVCGAKWISSMSIHPSGDHLIVGTLDRRLYWFDLDLGTTPYKVLRYHTRGIRQVAFFQRVTPHFPADISAISKKDDHDDDLSSDEEEEKQSNKSKNEPKGPHWPLMCTASDDGTVHVFHARVYNDLCTNPLIVPVKKLAKHEKVDSLGVMDCVWHPTQPWVFTCGADGKAYMWV